MTCDQPCNFSVLKGSPSLGFPCVLGQTKFKSKLRGLHVFGCPNS